MIFIFVHEAIASKISTLVADAIRNDFRIVSEFACKSAERELSRILDIVAVSRR